MPHNDRYKIIPSVYLILKREGKVLLARRCNTGYEDGNYGLVAGHAEEGETLIEALEREVREEAGVQLHRDTIKHTLTMHRWCGDHQRLDFFFTAEGFNGELTIAEPDLCDDMSWFPENEIPENTIAYIRHAIECHRDGVTYAEYEWPNERVKIAANIT